MYRLPQWLSGKEFACQAGDVDSVPGLGRFNEKGNGNPFQNSYWKISWTEEHGELQSMGPHKLDMT